MNILRNLSPSMTLPLLLVFVPALWLPLAQLTHLNRAEVPAFLPPGARSSITSHLSPAFPSPWGLLLPPPGPPSGPRHAPRASIPTACRVPQFTACSVCRGKPSPGPESSPSDRQGGPGVTPGVCKGTSNVSSTAQIAEVSRRKREARGSVLMLGVMGNVRIFPFACSLGAEQGGRICLVTGA